MRVLRWLLGALARILAAVLGLLAVLLCLTIILLPMACRSSCSHGDCSGWHRG